MPPTWMITWHQKRLTEMRVNLRSEQWELDQIEQSLRERYLESSQEKNDYIVRFIGTSGEIGRRCLTFNIEVREDRFRNEKMFLEGLVESLRADGWDIDELRQPLSANEAFDARLWLIIYEERNHHSLASGDSR
jgi:hypothetical protein